MDRFLGRQPHLLRFIAGILLCTTSGFFYHTTGLCTPASPQGAPGRSIHEKEKLVRQAVGYYKQGETAKAMEGLETSKAAFPENYAVPYYLGLIYLEQGNRRGAIAQWQQYVRMDPKSEAANNIRKHLTLLLREQAREFAEQAVAREAELAEGPADDRSIAVSSFINLGSENLGPVGKGMAAMLISDLSIVPGLQVVDRIKLYALLEEMKLGTSGLVDIKTAPRVGKLLKAKHVTSGSLADIDKEILMIASTVVDADQMASIGSQQAKGMLNEFYAIEKKIACQIIDDLGGNCTAAPQGFSKIHTKSLPALVSYSWGLAYFDEENYSDARDMFQKALEEDPQFDLAEEMLMATPTPAMLSMGTPDVIASVSSRGPSSDAAGTAVAVSTGTGSMVAVSAAADTVGFPPMTGIVAGVAAVGGGLALAGGGGGGGSSPSGEPIDLSGDWKGTWSNATGNRAEMAFSLTQSGSRVNGTVSVAGEGCLTTGTIAGNVSGDTANLSIHSGAETVTLNGTYDRAAESLTGRWNFTASSMGCTGDAGDYAATLTGGAEVSW
jgi:tetratricopeptide (TPR) repeat protein